MWLQTKNLQSVYQVKITFRLKFILLSLSSTLICSCTYNETEELPGFFDPPTEIQISKLEKQGFRYSAFSQSIAKLDNDTSIIFQFLPSSEPKVVSTRLISINRFTKYDSVDLSNFIDSKGGLMAGFTIKNSEELKFTVIGKKSKLSSECTLRDSTLNIIYRYMTRK